MKSLNVKCHHWNWISYEKLTKLCENNIRPSRRIQDSPRLGCPPTSPGSSTCPWMWRWCEVRRTARIRLLLPISREGRLALRKRLQTSWTQYRLDFWNIKIYLKILLTLTLKISITRQPAPTLAANIKNWKFNSILKFIFCYLFFPTYQRMSKKM